MRLQPAPDMGSSMAQVSWWGIREN